MLQFASYIAELPAIKVEVSVRRIGVTTAGIPIKHAQSNKCIEEVARAAFMDASALARSSEIKRSVCKRGEDSKLDRAQQRLCRPKSVAQFENPIRRYCRGFHDTPCLTEATITAST